jgi:hypothetical protein
MSDGLSQDLDQATEVPEIPAVEKKYTQQELEHVVHARLMKDREKQEKVLAQVQQQSRLPGGVGGGPTREEIEAMMEAKLQNVIEKAGQKAVAQKVMNDFTTKMASGYEKYPDFENKMKEFGLSEFTDIVQMATNTENTADVMYELATNPGKLGSILALSGRSQRKAMEAIQELSKSIKDNDSAKSNMKSREPLSQIKPTATAVDDGNAGIRDYMKQSWIRK